MLSSGIARRGEVDDGLMISMLLASTYPLMFCMLPLDCGPSTCWMPWAWVANAVLVKMYWYCKSCDASLKDQRDFKLYRNLDHGFEKRA